MTPAQPPPPTASYLPFHPDTGSQSSILISESLDGVSVAATRQKDARFAYGFAAGPFPLPFPFPSAGGTPPFGLGGGGGATNAPGATVSVKVILTFGSFNDAR